MCLLVCILQIVENMLIKRVITAVASVKLKQNTVVEGMGIGLFLFSFFQNLRF